MLRAQVNLTPRNILQASFLFNRASDPQFGLGPFTPLSTTTDTESRRYFVSVKDQVWMGRTLSSTSASRPDTGRSNSDPQGDATYVVDAIVGFRKLFSKRLRSSRAACNFVLGISPQARSKMRGMHTLSGGWNTDGIDFSQQATRESSRFRARGMERCPIAPTFSGPAALRSLRTRRSEDMRRICGGP